MKQYLRNRVSITASFLEILMSLFMIIAILIVSVSLIHDLVLSLADIIEGSFTFNFSTFIAQIMQIIIGIEFVKMLSKHTPESTIEVLLFVVARKIIIEEAPFYEMAIGIATIAVIFIIRKYFAQKTNPNGCILEADTSIREMNAILRTNCQLDGCTSVRDIIMKEMDEGKIPIAAGKEIIIGDLLFKIYNMKDGAIDAVEVTPVRLRHFNWPWSKERSK